ncbi:MAG: hypothetical protein V2J07_06075 [Anaerolineae bacterium]|jgi:hypothetical protein|nr:hypothetical protein [Anaerolineae bacterium]
MPTNHDKTILQNLAAQLAEIAALPVQEEKRELWRKLNALQPERPMVMIDQVCWHEMNVNDELTLLCEDAECRQLETVLRRILYQWKHFRVDMVVEPFIRIPKAINGMTLGLKVEEETAILDPNNDVISHYYENQFVTDADLDKIKEPIITHDAAETARRLEVAHEVFDGILAVRAEGADPYLSLWDPISTWMGVEPAMMAMIEKPDYIHELLERMTTAYLSMLDQLEEQGLLCGPQSLIHCTGAYTTELPKPGYDPAKPRTQDRWMFGLAQMLGSVSPRMFKTFEVDYASRICERFGLVYYGCCDPLHDRMQYVRMIPNVRKVSMSPWVKEDVGAEQIHGDFVYSRKPNPAHVAMDAFNPDLIRETLTYTRDLCAQYNTTLELILKDISTVRYEPQRLTQWAQIAMEVVGG